MKNYSKTKFVIQEDKFGSVFTDTKQKILELHATKNGFQWTTIGELDRSDLANLRNTIDEYLLKTAKQTNIE